MNDFVDQSNKFKHLCEIVERSGGWNEKIEGFKELSNEELLDILECNGYEALKNHAYRETGRRLLKALVK